MRYICGIQRVLHRRSSVRYSTAGYSDGIPQGILIGIL